jgi:nucleotide-binding universal stress UspA family protein
MTAPGLVFGDDGSECSERAWTWITSHDWPGWRVTVLTANADESRIEWGKPVTPRPWNPPWERDTTGLDAAEVGFFTAATDPRVMLGEVAADLVVVGNRGRGHLGSVMAGSTTEWLLHHPPAPLAVIRRSDPVTSVLVCTDGSEHATRAVAAFAALPWAARCAVTVLTVDDGRSDPGTALRAAHAALGELAATDLVKAGKPTSAILRVVGDTNPDLVVLGTRGLTGWRRLRLGSTAATVVRSVSCDSLVACVERGESE